MSRIDEIKVLADVYCDQNYPDASEAQYGLLWEDKFAELLIRECASIAYDGPGGVLEHFGLER